MAYSPENNPYIPGDPYSYDLKWMVKKINEWKDPLDSAEHAKVSEEAAATSAQESANSAINAAASAASIPPIANALNIRMDGLSNDINVLDARMDTFASLTEGSTTGDAELMDIRVAADGETYPTAGDAVRGQISDLNSKLASISNGTFKYSDVPGYYISETTGARAIDPAFTCSSMIDISEELVLQILNVGKRTVWNAFYDEDEVFISSFTCNIGNNYIPIPLGAKYCAISNETAYYNNTVLRKRARIVARSYDVYIAGSNSTQQLYADYVAGGSNDDELINIILSNSKVNSAYFFGDSRFELNAPIVLKQGMRIKSNGAVFTQPSIQTAPVTAVNVSPSSATMTTSASGTRFKPGQYLYYEDSRGNNSARIVQSITIGAGNQVITFTSQNGFTVDPQFTPILKTANPCFVIPGVDDVVIDGVTIDWNVTANPIQTYNPEYLQEGISIQQDSSNVIIKNCLIKNGGRRGICATDSINVLIDNCIINNWHEHAIDIFNGYTRSGNTLENPIINNCIISDCICHDNKMLGIQLHRGSGVIVSNCTCYNNLDGGIGASEYAHDNIISSCFLHHNGSGIVNRSGSKNNAFTSNRIVDNTLYGVNIIGTLTRCSDIAIKNNEFTGNGRHCVFTNTNDNIQIAGNTMHFTSVVDGDRAIQSSFGTNINILNNIIYNDANINYELIRCGGAGTDYCVIANNVIHASTLQPTSAGANDIITGNLTLAV